MTPSPDLLAVLREALPELRAVASTIQDCAEISAHSSWADRIDTALARIDSALRAHEAQGWELPPIERDESYDRTYIPLPGGWEIQTKGRGSSFRICDTKDGERWLVADEYLHAILERMAREVRAAYESRPTPAGEGVTEAMKRAGFDGFQKWCREQSPAYHVDPSSDPYYLNAIGAALEAALGAREGK
jgi:hypothetical protein